MHSFKNDYSEGAHPDILEALLRNNSRQEEGYGLDRHTLNVVSIIRDLVGDPEAAVHLISAGTQTNLVAISSFLRPHEACVTARTGHIATHETGAIEATGHKLLTVDTSDGKLSPQLIAPVLVEHHFEHMVKPKLVYVSNPSELGTIYTLGELSELSDYCRGNGLLLYIDGARLGAALVCQESGVSLEDVYSLADAFFIGGTKIGALFGEVLIVRNPALKNDLRYLIKQRGALLAKGRVLGVQFEALFKDNLYFMLAQHANSMAHLMVNELTNSGCTFWIDSPTNQIFPILENRVIEQLSKQFDFYVWAKMGKTRSAVRIVTSWATTLEDVQSFVNAYKKICRDLAGDI